MEKNKITVHTDGGARGNPGPAAIGVVIEGDPIGKKEYGEYIGETTNNEAEYRAVIFALKKLKQLLGSDKMAYSQIEFLLDSELVVKQLNRQYKLKDRNIQNFFIEIHNLVIDFGQVSFCHILRAKNTEADRIVNQVLDRESNKLGI